MGVIQNKFWIRRFAYPVLLLIASIGATVFLFGSVALTDNGCLVHVGDDAAVFSKLLSIGSPMDLLRAHADHLVPVLLMVYWFQLVLFGVEWMPYGILLILSHALLCWLIAFVILRVSRKPGVALATLVMILSSLPLAAGPVFNFINIAHYLINICLVLGLLLIHKRTTDADSKYIRGSILACALIPPFIHASGMLATGGLGLFVFLSCLSRSGFDLRRLVTQEAGLLVGFIAVCLFVATVYAFGVVYVGNPVPGSLDVSGAANTRVTNVIPRAINLLEYSYSGLFFPNFSNDGARDFLMLPWQREPVLDTRGLLSGILAMMLIVSFSSLRHGQHQIRRAGGMLLISFVVASILAAIVVVSGRPVIAFWVTRYAIYVVIYAALAIGVWLGLVVEFAENVISKRYRISGNLVSAVLVSAVLINSGTSYSVVAKRLLEFGKMRQSWNERPKHSWFKEWKESQTHSTEAR